MDRPARLLFSRTCACARSSQELLRQAVQLGLLPRFEIRHTSAALGGQVYLPRVNRLLLGGVLLLVLLFQTSRALASAYGIAVTGAMIIDSVLALLVLRYARRWPLWAAAVIVVPFVIIEAAFLCANLSKLHHGGYVPVLVAAWLTLMMVTWIRGNNILADAARRENIPLADLLGSLGRSAHLSRAPGTAVFLTSTPGVAPSALLHNLKHNRVLHQHNVVLTMLADPAPYVGEEQRLELTRLSDDFTLVQATFGYMEIAQRAQGADTLPPAWAQARADDHVLLPEPPQHPALGRLRHAAMAGPPVHQAGPRGGERPRTITACPPTAPSSSVSNTWSELAQTRSGGV